MSFLKKFKLLAIIGIAAIAIGGAGACNEHTHTYSEEYNYSETLHWREATCDHQEKIDMDAHIFDNACDPDCNVCGYTRTPAVHIFLNDCDTTCEVCGASRDVDPHVYDDAHDPTCNECGQERNVGEHIYDNDCDATCNECDHVRVVNEHIYDNNCDASCNECGHTRIPSDHIYDNKCDDTCNECGQKRTVEGHVHDNDCDTTCNNCCEEREVGDHIYDNDCDPTCNECGDIRIPSDHQYDNDCDTTCNECGEVRETCGHQHDHNCDTTCNECGEVREVDGHLYDNDCDGTCNECGEVRTPSDHIYSNQCDTTCDECGHERTVEEHVWSEGYKFDEYEEVHFHYCIHCDIKGPRQQCVYDQEVAEDAYLYQAATTTTKAKYYRSCKCGNYAPSTDNVFELEKLPANLVAKLNGKYYDGLPLDPVIKTGDPDAEVSIMYADYTGGPSTTWYTTAPKDAGVYLVRIASFETETHKSGFIETSVRIEKAIINVDVNDFTLVVEQNSGKGATVLANGICDGIVEGEELYINIKPTDDSVLGVQELDIASITTEDENYQLKTTDKKATFIIRPAGESFLAVTSFGTSGSYYTITGDVSGVGIAKGDILKVPNTDIVFEVGMMRDGDGNDTVYVGDGGKLKIFSTVIIDEMDPTYYETLRSTIRLNIILVKDDIREYSDTYLMKFKFKTSEEGGRTTPIICDGTYVATLEMYGNKSRKALFLDVYGESTEGMIMPGEEVTVLVQFINNDTEKLPFKTVILPHLSTVTVYQNTLNIGEGAIAFKQREIETNFNAVAYEGAIGGKTNDSFLYYVDLTDKYDMHRMNFYATSEDADVGTNTIAYITTKFSVLVVEITDTEYIEHAGALDSNGNFYPTGSDERFVFENGCKYFIQVTLLTNMDAFYLALI